MLQLGSKDWLMIERHGKGLGKTCTGAKSQNFKEWVLVKSDNVSMVSHNTEVSLRDRRKLT